MKKNDFAQIKGSDIKELLLKVKTLKVEVAGLTLDKNMKKLKDLKMISKKRKDLAQILTVVRQKELLIKLETEASKISKKNEVVAGDSSVKTESKKKTKTKGVKKA